MKLLHPAKPLVAGALLCGAALPAAASSPPIDLSGLFLLMLLPLAIAVALFVIRQVVVYLTVPAEQRRTAAHRTRTRRWLGFLLIVAVLELFAYGYVLFQFAVT